jgi:hypothetical protein
MFVIAGTNTTDEVGRTRTFIVPSGDITGYCNAPFPMQLTGGDKQGMQPMGKWMTDAEKGEFVKVVEGRFRSGTVGRDEILRTKMDLDTTEAQMQAALAEERAASANEIAAAASVKNARYMLWSVIAAAVSAVASLVSTAIAVFGHH